MLHWGCCRRGCCCFGGVGAAGMLRRVYFGWCACALPPSPSLLHTLRRYLPSLTFSRPSAHSLPQFRVRPSLSPSLPRFSLSFVSFSSYLSLSFPLSNGCARTRLHASHLTVCQFIALLSHLPFFLPASNRQRITVLSLQFHSTMS
jgi:hypothetical protein